MNASVVRTGLAVLGLSILFAIPSVGQTTTNLTPFDVARLKSVGQIASSPDGLSVLYSLAIQADPFQENAPARSEVHLLDLRSGEDRILLSADINARSLSWTPGSESVSFLAKMEEDEHTSLYAIQPGEAEIKAIVRTDRSIRQYDWSPEGDKVAFVAEGPEAANPSVLPVSPNVYEEDATESKVWIAQAFDLEATPRMIDHDGSADAVAWSPDNNRIAVTIAPSPHIDDWYMLRRIHVLDATNDMQLSTIENPGKLGRFAWSPDGKYIAMVSGIDENDPREGRLLIASATGGELADIVPGLKGHVEDFLWKDARSIVYLAGVGVESVIGTVDVDGSNASTLVGDSELSIASFDLAGESSRIVMNADTPRHPGELYVWDAAAASATRLTNSNPWLEGLAMGKQEVVKYKARDGMDLEGLLIRPMPEQPGQRYPLVVVVHGGPESHYANGWLTGYGLPGQVAAGRGMAVFYPNYRGSTGRGVEFSKTSQADPAGKEFDDIVDGVDHLISTGLVDADRVGVTGGSYGGYATAWMSTYYSDRFAAGVMFVGISNKISKVGTTDIPNEELLVHARMRPWDNWQFFLERSPVYYADRNRTPLLIMHGAEDPRVNPGQSRELYRHLKLRGKAPVRLVFYPGEGHGNRMSAARLDYSLRAMRWLEHYLLGPGGDPPPYAVKAEMPVHIVEPSQ